MKINKLLFVFIAVILIFTAGLIIQARTISGLKEDVAAAENQTHIKTKQLKTTNDDLNEYRFAYTNMQTTANCYGTWGNKLSDIVNLYQDAYFEEDAVQGLVLASQASDLVDTANDYVDGCDILE